MLDSFGRWARQALIPRLTLMHVAAVLLLLASGLANVRYGLMLGSDGLEKFIAVGASIGADLFNAVGVAAVASALVAGLWTRAAITSFVLVLTLSYSLVAGIGFASQTRTETVGHRAAIVRQDKLAEAAKTEAETKLAALQQTRPIQQIQADVDQILADPRANACRTVDGPYTRQKCPRFFELKAELAASQERVKLEAKRDEAVRLLSAQQTIAAADPLTDSLATYLGKLGLSGTDQNLLPWLSLLFVMLVVVGGPVALWLGEASVQKPSDPEPAPTTKKGGGDSGGEKTEPEPVVRPRKVVALTPVAATTVDRIKKRGGAVQGRTQAAIASQLGLPRTSFRRVMDRLEADRFVSTEHNEKTGYTVRVTH